MKLLCDVCSNAVASVFCCADEAALCSVCDCSVHAANKLASKHQRIPLHSEIPAEPAICDICQEMPSFFFCVEDRALLCRECDVSVHSANSFAAKHSRVLLTYIKVGMRSIGIKSQEATANKKAPLQVKAALMAENCDPDNGGDKEACSKPLPRAQKTSKEALAPVPRSLDAYSITKDGALSTASTINMNSDLQNAAASAHRRTNSTTISIRRISAGQQVPFVAPVLSSLHPARRREEACQASNGKDLENSTSTFINSGQQSNSSRAMVSEDTSFPAVSGDHLSNYLSSGVPGWRFDELLTDLVGVCDNGQSASSPTKEVQTPGLGLQEEHAWLSELEFPKENELSISQEDSVALVPEMPSPPTNSGLVISQGKWASYPTARHWDFDHLFTGPDHVNEFSVVPNVGRRRSLCESSVFSDRFIVNKSRKQ